MALPGIPAKPVEYDLDLFYDNDLRFTGALTYGNGTPVDLTGCTLTAVVETDFVTTPVLTLTCALSGTPTDGTFTISAAKAAISALTLPTVPATQRTVDIGFWQLHISDGSIQGRFAQGSVRYGRAR